MLNQIDSAKSIIRMGLIAISTAFAVTLDHALATPLRAWSGYISIGIIALSGCVFQYFAELAINKSAFLRKIISGHHYIEGTWIEVYKPNDDDPNYSVELISISVNDSRINIAGETYNMGSFRERGTWKSKASDYENGTLFYFYEETVNGKDVTGSGRLDFTRVGGYPTKYLSRIFDPIHTEQVLGRGHKLENKSELEQIRKGGVDLRNVLSKYSQDNPNKPELVPGDTSTSPDRTVKKQ